MFMTNSNDKSGELLGQERRRRWSPEQKLAMVRESLEPGQSVSVVARRNGINANQLFLWRKLYQDGSLSAVSAGEAVVPASELSDALKQIRELQRMLGKKRGFSLSRWHQVLGVSRRVGQMLRDVRPIPL
jgi:transposase